MVTPNPLKLIEAIRNSTPYMHVIYTHGSCWKFYEILKTVYPDAKPYYRHDHGGGHIITKIGRKYYDINGEVANKYQFLPFDEKHFPNYTHYAKNWWCKFATLATAMEDIVMTDELRKAFKYE